ncbi:hypothetical protein, partial [Clostridium perfringens]|uniref:hypothetical protein n=1 Tax=Clostridium perfringens TaxID=1502 RepID=UPI001930EA17
IIFIIIIFNCTILRDYTDYTIKYDYDENNQVKLVKGLTKTGSNSYVKHIKENFISKNGKWMWISLDYHINL